MNLNLFAPLNQTSYGYVSTFFFRELLKNNVDVSYFPIGPIQVEQSVIDELRDHLNEKALVKADAPCLKIWHQHDLAHFVGNGEHVGFPIFELDSFSETATSHMQSCDELVVCSQWAKQVLLNNDIIEPAIHVVPLGYDPEVFNLEFNDNSPFIFGNFGKWELRKGHDVLVQAFNNAFTEDDDVELWLFPHNFHISENMQKSWEGYYYNSKLGSKIKIFPRLSTQQDLAKYMKKIHCGVFPSRAEGWNLEALECLACGKHVIATDYSAHTEFLSDRYASLIKLNEREDAFDGVFFKGDGRWASWTKDGIDELTEAMKTSYKNGPSINQEGLSAASEFTWQKSTQKLIKVLRRL